MKKRDMVRGKKKEIDRKNERKRYGQGKKEIDRRNERKRYDQGKKERDR